MSGHGKFSLRISSAHAGMVRVESQALTYRVANPVQYSDFTHDNTYCR